MAITKNPPNTVHLGGSITWVNDTAASEAITPGHLIERFNDSGTLKYRKHSDAGGAGNTFALNQPELNAGVDDALVAGDLVLAAIASPGSTFWALIPSGANITQGGLLESNGDGTLKAASAGVAVAQALESVNNTAGPGAARIRVEAL